VADNCLYVWVDTEGVCKALQTARRWGHPECRTLTFVMDCLRLALVRLAGGGRIFLEPGSNSANHYWGRGAPVIFASVRNASERERKPHQHLVDIEPVCTERNVETL
jgi:hypothetical protein